MHKLDTSTVMWKLMLDIFFKFICYLILFKVYMRFIHPMIKRKRYEKKIAKQFQSGKMSPSDDQNKKEFDQYTQPKVASNTDHHGKQTDFEKEVLALHNLVMSRKGRRRGGNNNFDQKKGSKSGEKFMEELENHRSSRKETLLRSKLKTNH